MRLAPTLTLAALITAAPAAADEPTPIAVKAPAGKTTVSYARDVADILADKCVGCHSEALAENKLNLEEVAGMLKGGKRGPALVPGKADESLLFKMAAHRVEPVMPPKDKKANKPMTPEELGLLKLWIDSGAKDDSAEVEKTTAPVQLGELPPGVQPINAVDLTADGARVVCGRANVVQVYDAVSGLEIISLGGHKDLIQSVRFSPDGRRLAAGSYEIVTLWDAPTGGRAATFTGHTEPVAALAAGGDGQTVVSGGLDKTIRFWDPAGKPLRQVATPSAVLALAVSRDGKTLAAGGADGVVRVYAAADGKEPFALKGHTAAVHDLAFLPDGRGLVSASADGGARLWKLPARVGETPPEPFLLDGGKKPVRAAAITPDGATVLTAGDDGKVRLWHANDGKLVREIAAHDAPVLALAVDPKGDRVLTGSADRSARLFALSTGERKATLEGHPGPIESVAFSLDGRHLATAGEGGGIKVWDAATGQGVIAFGHTADGGAPAKTVRRLVFTGAGALVSASDGKTLAGWTFEGAWRERKTLGPHTFRVLALDFNPDGTLLAAGGGEPSRSGEIQVWEVGKGMHVRTLDGVHSDTVLGLRFSPDGARLASAGADKFLKVTRVADGKEIRAFEGHTHHVLAVDWKSDGKQIVTGGADNVIKLWDFETGEQVRTFNAAGKQVTSVRWEAGKPKVVGASGDKLVRVWNSDNGAISQSLSGPSDYVFGVAVSADGARIAAGGADSVLFLWDAAGKVVHKIEPPAPAKAPSR
jgi:WD40 repeat protein